MKYIPTWEMTEKGIKWFVMEAQDFGKTVTGPFDTSEEAIQIANKMNEESK